MGYRPVVIRSMLIFDQGLDRVSILSRRWLAAVGMLRLKCRCHVAKGLEASVVSA